MNYQCYYCQFETDVEDQYVRHGAKNHLYLPIFPGEADLARHNLTPQGKSWEKYNITTREAERRLASWAGKKLKW